ncbi:hypothetical protein SS1G_13837 [Sclerotinia sclerotiorum 1980 UF-70]|uniref:C2H2-type domain-containing protein n=1 Tax=Sclerotinia sclerotiorum (strain ATCC 18683 / 1980 / Ss-1) TaxID=665079 RepID=A7F8A6_SCLS1|nr:hypothetical protein SS1G_13837 [Sclerotinia sclerotiorum 1980 UF-70]EDN98977.1 hypothetical protein SS1G_13837 [Sclerotinia sclerotiorum 1980 UF-70]
MPDKVHSFTHAVHSNFHSDSAPVRAANMDNDASAPRKSGITIPASSFGCSLCPKSFNRRENLSRHMKTHDVPRTHICQICEKTFTRSDLLKRHEAGHERWDKLPKSEGRRGSVKRRKTSEDPAESPKNLENFNWATTTTPESAHLSPLSNEATFPPATASYATSFQEPIPVNMSFLENREQQSLGNNQTNWISPEAAPRSFMESQQLNINISATHPVPSFNFLHHEADSFPQQYRESFQDAALDNQIPTNSLGIMEYSYQVPFNHASYLQPENNQIGNTGFSDDFYAAMLETGNQWGIFPNSFNQNFPLANQVQQSFSNIKLESPGLSSTIMASEPRLEYHQSNNITSESLLPRPASITRVSSPPNLPWEEHSWPLLWNPISATLPMLEAGPIDIPSGHHLFQNHNPSLIRNPMIILTQALLIHTGLWCGNKRAFNVAEAYRGNAISHMRQLYEGEKWNASMQRSSVDETSGDTQVQWKRWIHEESLNRLYWFIYTIDRQFPALWNKPSTITIGEMVDVSCPCDETFWCAPTAEDWKFALGSATIPKAPSFAAAIGPFLFSPTTTSPTFSLGNFSSQEQQLSQSQHLSLPNLNPYTAFLVLLEIQHQIFDFSQEHLLATKFLNRQDVPETQEKSHYTPNPSPSQALKSSFAVRRQKLALGQTGIAPALENLKSWARDDPELAIGVALRAAEAIMEINKSLEVETSAEVTTEIPKAIKGGMIETGVYGTSLLMMTHVILWAFARVSDRKMKEILMKELRAKGEDCTFLNLLECEFQDLKGDDERLRLDLDMNIEGGNLKMDQQKINAVSKVLLRSAADLLMRFGTWGVALDMALLLHLRGEG